jgi:hypothetical protein
MDHRNRMDDITASYLESLDFSPRPRNKLSMGRFFEGSLSPSIVSRLEYVSTEQTMTSATHLISLIILLYILM